MPFEFSGEMKEKAPRITFRDEEELRYQNDYFKLPEKLGSYNEFSNAISNEVVPNFKTDKTLSMKDIKQKVPMTHTMQKYAEPLKYMNPIDKFHNHNDVETFSASERIPTMMAYKRERPKYSHYQEEKKPSHDKSSQPKLTRNGYKPPKPQMHQASRPTDNFPQDNPGFFKLPKLGPGAAAGQRFPQPPADGDLQTDTRPPRRDQTGQSRIEALLPNLSTLPRLPKPTQRQTSAAKPTAPRRSRPTPSFSPRWAAQRPTPRASTKKLEPTSFTKTAWGPNGGDRQNSIMDYDDYYYYDENDINDNHDVPQSRSYPEPPSNFHSNSNPSPPKPRTYTDPSPPQLRSYPDLGPPKSRTYPDSSPPQSRSFPNPGPPQSRSYSDPSSPRSRNYQNPSPPQKSVKPAPLGPPQAILEMQHDSVFSGNFDVPKLGTNMAYKPPEMIYNEMYSQPKEHSELPSFQKSFLPPPQSRTSTTPKVQPQPRERSRFRDSFLPPPPSRETYSPTAAPFLPTPSKSYRMKKPEAFQEYGHLYDSPYKPIKRQRSIHKSPSPPPTPPTFEKPPQDFFRPISSPSITFEPTSEELGPYNEKMLHNLVANELDSGHDQDDVFLPFIEEEAESFPDPPASHQLRNTLYHDYDTEPRYKRYQDVDYTPQHPDDYSYDTYEPQRFNGEDPFHLPPTPQPISYDDDIASFLPPPADFSPESRGLPQFNPPEKYSSDYYTSDYNSADYYPNPEHHEYSYDYRPEHHEVPDYSGSPLGLQHLDINEAWGNKEDVTDNANQFVNVAAPDVFEHGHVRGNPMHKKQEYTRREGRQFKSQVGLMVVIICGKTD